MFINSYKLGLRICQIRKKQGLTQEALAEITGFTSHYIGNIEQGVRNPSVDALLAISVALKTTPNDLLTDSIPQELLDELFDDTAPHSLRDSMYHLSTLTDFFDNQLRDGDRSAPDDDAQIPQIHFMRLDEPFENDPNLPLNYK